MGNKISCANCNGKPASTIVTTHHKTSVGPSSRSHVNTTAGQANVAQAASRSHYAHHYHPQILSAGNVPSGGTISNILTGRSNHILRLWAEVFHVSASSGAVRWNQVSDDLVPVTVGFINGRYHITAFNSRVEKVLDCWLQSNKLGQASSCFIYWKDNVSGDTWGLNFTSPADARAFRECIQSGTVQLQTGHTLPKRTESSYSLRGTDQPTTEQQQQPQQQRTTQSKAGSGAHLTTKYYSNRTAISTPNSPSKRRHQQQDLQTLCYGQQPQCTCDCLTAEMLHKQRNGRIRYANFTRQDSGGTTQSSRSDGSLVRRQHDRQQQYYRAHQRSMDEHYRNRVCVTPVSSRTLAPSHRRVAQAANQSQQIQQQSQQRLPISSAEYSTQNGSGGGYIQIQHQKAIVHANSKQVQEAPGPSDVHHIQAQQQQQQQQPPSRPQSQAQTQTQQLVSTATTTDDLDQQQNVSKRSSQRPKSLVSNISSSTEMDKCRDRTHRSLEGRRRSLERMQCVDLTDASPTVPVYEKDGTDDRPSAAQLEEYERELRRRLLMGAGDSGQNDALETFETLLKESMDDVANLMREVQHELTLIRAEEKRYQSQSTQSLHRISSSNLGLTTGPRSPVFDTMSIDGQLPFLPSFASSLANASSAYHNSYQSWDRLAGYLTSSEISDDERASLTTAVSDDEDLLINTKSSFKPKGSSVSFECLGSVRKSGFLSVKKWLIRKRHTLELAQKRGWKGYWVCLKGTTLLFYSCDANMANPNNSSASGNLNQSGSSSEAGINQQQSQPKSATGSTSELTPKHLIIVDICLVQPVPEHPRRDNVFCLSTSLGDAYLFDATSLPERDQWIQVIHTACAAQIARNSGRCTISHYLVEKYQHLEQLVDEDCQSKQEAELLLTCCTEEKQKHQLVNHVLLLEEKMERNRIEIFRLKSYFAALTNDEGPNPKTLLSQASRRTKAQLNRIGVFTVSSLHAFNCAKNPQSLERSLQRQNSFGNFRYSNVDIPSSITPPIVRDIYSPTNNPETTLISSPSALSVRCTINVLLLTGEQRTIEVPNQWTSEQVLSDLFGPGPESREYFLRCSETGTILYRHDLINNYSNHTLLVAPKILFTIDLVRESNEILFGFSVESELCQSNLRVFVMRVEPNSIAALHGLCRHDEIMVINGALVQELDMMFVESILQEELTLCLMIRSSRIDVPVHGQAILKNTVEMLGNVGVQSIHHHLSQPATNEVAIAGSSFDNEKTSSVTDELIESLVCPPPPSTDFSQLILSDTQLSKYIVPKVDHFLPTTENLVSMNVINDSSPTANINFDDDDGFLLANNSNNGVGATSSMIIQDNPLQLMLTPEESNLNMNNDLNMNNIDAIIATKQPVITPASTATSISLPSLMTSKSTILMTCTTATTNVAGIKHMKKLLNELLDTENSFCKSLKQLVTLYLEPLSQNNFLTPTDIKVLFGSILKVIDAQNEFRSELTEVGEHILGDCQLLLERCQSNTSPEPTVNELGVGYIADCFAKHSKNFRDYSTFCASHARAVKLMAQEKTAVHEWLQKQSNGQISQSLESYLIRPIQRVLKYPLLLGQMKALCNKSTTNYTKLEDAIKDLEKVAEHINEMQRIQEEYGAIFEHLARNHTRMAGNSNLGKNGIIDLSPPALKHYGNVDWINSMEFLGKNCRKAVEWSSICFVFSQCVVFLCKETIRQRKRMATAKSIDVEIIRHQVLIPVIEVQVRPKNSSNDPNPNETDNKWDLIQLKMNAGKRSEKIYQLSNKTNEERNEFLRIIRQIIREDVRRMNINVNVGSTMPLLKSSQIRGAGGEKTGRNKPSALQITNTEHSKNRLTSNSKISIMKMMQQQQHHCDDHHSGHHGHHHHHHHRDQDVHKVPCGLCGKEVALGHQRQAKEKSNSTNTMVTSTTTTTVTTISTNNWKHHHQTQRQDSSSTTSH